MGFIIGGIFGCIVGYTIGGDILWAIIGGVLGGLVGLGTAAKQDAEAQHQKNVKELLDEVKKSKDD